MSNRLAMAMLVLAVALAGGNACQGTPTTCKGWAKLLKSPVQGRDAIKNLGDLHCKENLADLEEVFATSQYKEDILQTVKAINAPQESKAIILKGLADPTAATLAAAVAEDFKLPEFRPALLQILTTDKALKARENALKALAGVDGKDLQKDEDLLITLMTNDPNVQGIAVNAIAARLLGDMRSVKAVPKLVLALFIRTQRGEQLYTPVRKALAKIGKPAVAQLVAVLTDAPAGEAIRKDLQDYAKKLGMPDWQWHDGPEIVQVLGDLRDPAAAMAVATGLAKPLNPPVGVDDRVMNAWIASQQNRITMSMMALWNMGTAEVVPTLRDVIVNTEDDAKQRLDTASALAMLPGFVGIGTMVDVFPKVPESTLRAPMVKPVAMGLDWAHAEAFEKDIKADKSQLVRERVDGEASDAKEYAIFLGILKDCGAGDVDCLIGKVKGPDMAAAMKATILLAGSPLKPADAKRAVAALVERYPNTDPVLGVDLRRFLLLGIWRLGDRGNVADLQKMLQSDHDRKGAGYWIDELEVMIPVMAAKP